MGLFQKIFGTGKNTSYRLPASEYKTLTAYNPTFTSFNGQIYESELVRAAINARATHISKLKVEFSGFGSQVVSQRLKRPNAYQTWSQFMSRLSTIYDVENSAFIVPTFDSYDRIAEIYPVLPSRCKLVEFRDQPWLSFEFRDGHFAQLPIWQVGIMTKFQYRRDFFGEDNKALNSTMALIDIQNQAITEGVKSSATFRFMAQYNNMAFGDDLKKEQDLFNNKAASDGGMAILFPKTFENIQQINSKPFVADPEQMRMIENNVCSYFGVNENVLQNKAFGDSWSAFYEGAIEPFAIMFSETMTALFNSCGEKSIEVLATANRLQYMSNKEKLDFSTSLTDRGIMNRDEIREIWNLPPLPNGEGKAYVIRGEYKNANDQVNEGDDSNA